MPYTYQLENRRRVRRAILAGAAIGGLFLLLAIPERMLGWSGLGVGTLAVPEAPAVTEVTAEKPVAALRTPPSLNHLAFPAYAEWTELTEASCVDCDWNWSYGADSLVDAVDTEALVQLERSSTPPERTADASHFASGLRGLAGGAVGGVGGGGLTGGGSSQGASAKREDGTSKHAATAPPAEEVSEAGTTETSEAVAEAVAQAGGVPAGSWGGSPALAVAASDPVPLPSLQGNVGSQTRGATAGPADEAWAPVEAAAINPPINAGAIPLESSFSPDPRNVPPPPTPEPPTTPDPPTEPETPTQPETPTVPEAPVPDPPAVPEPTSLILLGLALSAVVYRMRRIDR